MGSVCLRREANVVDFCLNCFISAAAHCMICSASLMLARNTTVIMFSSLFSPAGSRFDLHTGKGKTKIFILLYYLFALSLLSFSFFFLCTRRETGGFDWQALDCVCNYVCSCCVCVWMDIEALLGRFVAQFCRFHCNTNTCIHR